MWLPRSRRWALAAVAGAALLLAACPILAPPGILNVSIIIDDRTKDVITPGITAVVSYLIKVDSSYAARQVNEVVVTDSDGNVHSWTGDEVTDAWDETTDRFELIGVETPLLPHSVALGSTSVSIASEGHPAEVYSFDVFAAGDASSNSGYVYTNAGLANPQILPPPTGFDATIGGGTLSVVFDAVDPLVEEAYAWLLDTNGSLLHVNRLDSAQFPLNTSVQHSYDDAVSAVSGVTAVQLMLFSEHNGVGDDRVIYRSMSDKDDV